MLFRRVLAVFTGLVLSVVARAQTEPPIYFPGEVGRPAGGWVEVDDGTDDLVNKPVVVQPSPTGSYGWVIIEVKNGLPIIAPINELTTVVNPQQGTQGQIDGDDDHDDFVIVNDNGNSSSLSILLGQAGTLSGNNEVSDVFAAEQTIALSSSIVSPRLVASLDADTDGDDDVLVGTSSAAYLFLNQGAPNYFSGTPSATFSFPNSTLRDIAVGRLDAGSRDDFVLVGGSGPSGAVTIYTQNTSPAASFSSTTFTPSELWAVASVELVDFAQDGYADLVLALHKWTAGAPYQGDVRIYKNLSGTIDTTADYTGTRTSATGTLPTFGAAGDVEGDDDIDMCFTQTDSIAYIPGTFDQYSPPLQLFYVENHFVDNPSLGLTFATRGTRFTGRANDPVLVPFEGSGDAMILPNLAVTWTINQSAGPSNPDEPGKISFSASTQSTDGMFLEMGPETFSTGLIPGDGAAAEVGRVGTQPANALDIVVPNLISDSLTVALGNSEGEFTTSAVNDVVHSPPSLYAGGPCRVVLSELTGDGYADAVVGSDFMNASADLDSVISILHSNGSTLVYRQERALSHAGDMAVADIDRDGNKDVIVTRRLGVAAPQDVQVHFGNGSGQLDNGRTPYTKVPSWTGILTGGLAVADIDGDTDVDIVTTYARSVTGGTEIGVVVFRNDWATQSGLVVETVVYSTGSLIPDVESLVLGTMNGTSAIDVAVGLRDGGLWYAQGTAGAPAFTWQGIDVESRDSGGGSLSLINYDGDSMLDLVSCKGWPAHQSVVQVHMTRTNNNFQVEELAGWCPEDFNGATRPIVGNFNPNVLSNTSADIAIVHVVGEVTVLLR